MDKALIILKREYLTRIRNKSFLIITFLVPLLFVGVTAFSVWMATRDSSEEQSVAIYDETGMYLNRIKGSDLVNVIYVDRSDFLELKTSIANQDVYDALLYIPHNLLRLNTLELFSKNQLPRSTQNLLRRQLEYLVESDKKAAIYNDVNVPGLEARINATATSLNFKTLKVSADGSSIHISSELNGIIGLIAGFIIYMMIFIYGSMVMRGVMEEKTNRISEVLISSVKPMQLMFGKIIGIGLVGLTQFALWIILTGITLAVGSSLLMPGSADALQAAQTTNSVALQNSAVYGMLETMQSVNLPLVISSFFIYFIFGYLLYASIMGAIGSAVSSDEDAQQMVSIAAIPLILAIIMITPVGEAPNGSLALWTSLFPLFSPVTMVVRIPAGVPMWQLASSIALLIITTLVCIWLAGKIYRVGILMYGKKASFKELIKWIRYS